MSRRGIAAALFAVVVLAAFGAPLASDDPDGLQRVARDEGFAGEEKEHALGDAPYAVGGIDDEEPSPGLSGALGVVVVFVAAGGAFAALRLRDRRGGAGP